MHHACLVAARGRNLTEKRYVLGACESTTQINIQIESRLMRAQRRVREWLVIAVLAMGANTLVPNAIVSFAQAEVKVSTETAQGAMPFTFPSIAPPAINDAASKAVFKIVDGAADPNSGPLKVLQDGGIPSSDDAPSQNFFYSAGSTGGRLEVDLGSEIEVAGIASYSSHTSTRAPQVYKLYGADGRAEGFRRDVKNGVDPLQNGWSLIADVDSRTVKTPGSQHAVAISATDGTLGRFQYLMFAISATENQDAFGNTFLSEIDVFDKAGPEPVRIAIPRAKTIEFATADSQYKFTIDLTKAPDLEEWTETQLKPVVQEWYPKIVDLLPSPGYVASRKVTLRYLEGSQMNGVPAYASGSVVSMNADWFRKELKREARGAVVHELVHVVQAYQGGDRRTRRRNPTPGWIVEGIPDYVRWFLYEPQSRGAEINDRNLAAARYDASYRVSANFLDWVAQVHGKDVIVKLNAAAREGRYQSSLWEELTGSTEQKLDSEWKEFHQKRLNKPQAN